MLSRQVLDALPHAVRIPRLPRYRRSARAIANGIAGPAS
jgi:hypothetical protein